MIAEAIKAILALSPPATFQINGKDYSSTKLQEVKPEQKLPPLLPQVCVHTLTGLADLISGNLDKQFGAEAAVRYAIHVENFNRVSLVRLDADMTDDRAQRLTLIQSTPVEFQPFEFGKWHDQESFAISCRARFCDTADLAYVLQMASTLTNEAIGTSEDDGFTQKATVKAGLKQKETVTVKPVVELAPFRIFPEVPQPVSQFVFRARIQNDSPALALFEADGGKWKNDAIKAISQYLKALQTELPIIA